MLPQFQNEGNKLKAQNLSELATSIERLLAVYGTGADMLAGLSNATAASGPIGTPQDRVNAGINFIKVATALASLFRTIPVIGSLTAVAALTDSVASAANELESTKKVSTGKVLQISADILAICSTAAFGAAVSGALGPIAVTVGVYTFAASFFASIASSAIANADNRATLRDLNARAASLSDSMGGRATWGVDDDELFLAGYASNPTIAPTLLLLRALSSSISLQGATAVLGVAGVGSSRRRPVCSVVFQG
jgi:hypothetical protein